MTPSLSQRAWGVPQGSPLEAKPDSPSRSSATQADVNGNRTLQLREGMRLPLHRPRPAMGFSGVHHASLRLPRRPGRALVRFRDGAQTLVHELLNAFSFVGFRRVQVALRVGGNAVHGIEHPRLTSAVAEAGQDLERGAIHDVDLLVGAI